MVLFSEFVALLLPVHLAVVDSISTQIVIVSYPLLVKESEHNRLSHSCCITVKLSRQNDMLHPAQHKSYIVSLRILTRPFQMATSSMRLSIVLCTEKIVFSYISMFDWDGPTIPVIYEKLIVVLQFS